MHRRKAAWDDALMTPLVAQPFSVARVLGLASLALKQEDVAQAALEQVVILSRPLRSCSSRSEMTHGWPDSSTSERRLGAGLEG